MWVFKPDLSFNPSYIYFFIHSSTPVYFKAKNNLECDGLNNIIYTIVERNGNTSLPDNLARKIIITEQDYFWQNDSGSWESQLRKYLTLVDKIDYDHWVKNYLG